MAGSALILLREGLEGALIVAMVLAYLRKLGRRDKFRSIWLGAGAALAIVIVVGVVMFVTIGEFQGDARVISFATVMLLATAVLTWMIFWMRRQARSIKGSLHSKVDIALVSGSVASMAAVVFFGVLREGLETVLFFLAAAGQSSPLEGIVGGLLGLAAAFVLAYAFYRGAGWLNLRTFFMASGALVLLLAAGLFSRGIAKLQSLDVLPTTYAPVYDVSNYSALSTDHFFGELVRGLFGWNPAPNLLEVACWVGYVAIVGVFYLRGMSTPKQQVAAKITTQTAPEALLTDK